MAPVSACFYFVSTLLFAPLHVCFRDLAFTCQRCITVLHFYILPFEA
jgi:hypothetical protein